MLWGLWPLLLIDTVPISEKTVNTFCFWDCVLYPEKEENILLSVIFDGPVRSVCVYK